MKTKIYKVMSTNGSAATRLVEAVNKSQAIRHAARHTFRADLATQQDLVALVSQGVAVEAAEAELPEGNF
jgi:hypothetical protein